MNNLIRVTSVLICATGLILAVIGSAWWAVAVCIGLCLSTNAQRVSETHHRSDSSE